jgi:hypothetical protein
MKFYARNRVQDQIETAFEKGDAFVVHRSVCLMRKRARFSSLFAPTAARLSLWCNNLGCSEKHVLELHPIHNSRIDDIKFMNRV